MLACCGCGGENWWCLYEDALRIVVVGKPGSDEKPQKGSTLAKMPPRVIERGGITLHIWEEPAASTGNKWALDYKESFYDITFELPDRCRGRTTYGPDLAIPLVVVGTMSDLRHTHERERKLITDSAARSLAEKVSALYYVEVSASERTNVDLLWDVLAKSKSMRQWVEARELRNRRLGLSPPEGGTADDEPLLPSAGSGSRCVLS